MLRTYSANNIVYVMYTFFQYMGKEGGGILWSVKKKIKMLLQFRC